MEILAPILLILGLLLLIIVSIVFVILPTAINLLVTAIFVWPLWKRTNSIILAIPLFVALSFVFAMNIRLFDIVSDLTASDLELKSHNHKLKLAYGTRIKLNSSIDTISYKKHPLETQVLGGDEGCMCTYYNNPRIVHEQIKKELTNLGLVVSNTDADVVINITGESDGFITNLILEIKDKGDLITKKGFRIRNRYHGDLDLSSNGRSDDGSMIPFLTRNTFWNYVLRFSGLIKDQDKVVMSSIEKSIDVVSTKHEEVVIEAKVLENIVPAQEFIIKQGLSGDIVWCDPEIVSKDRKVYSGLYVKHKGLVIPIEHKMFHTEKVICTEDDIYIVTTPKERRKYIQISVFDYKGHNANSVKYIVPSRKWRGYPRKPLVYFENKDDEIIVGIQEFGKKINTENIYYALPKDISNKQ